MTGLVAALLAGAVPAGAAEPAFGQEVKIATDAWQAADAAVTVAQRELATATEEQAATAAAAAVAEAEREREQQRLLAAQAVLDAARHGVTEASGANSGEPEAEPVGERATDVPGVQPSGDEPGGGSTGGGLREVTERVTPAGGPAGDPERDERLAAAERVRDQAADAFAEQEAVYTAAAAASRQRADEAAAAATALERAEQQFEDRTAEHVATLASLRDLGWRAGVPGRHGLVWPVDGAPRSQFGARRHPIHGTVRLHAGVDVPGTTGQIIVAAAAGTVTFAGARSGYGFTVDIDHGGGRTTRYAHLSYIHVRTGARVEQSQRIAKLGSSGASTGPHLHWEVRDHDQPRDPLRSFPQG